MNLPSLPSGFAETRGKLHQLAFFALAPARFKATGRMGLRAKPGGFGTPEFDGQVARIEQDLLVLESGESVATQTITTIRAAAQFFGVGYEQLWFKDFKDQLPPMDPDAQLSVDVGGALAIADWFHFGTEVLERLRGHGVHRDEVSETQIWPEHFDAAIEMGDDGLGQRASYGASPGDGAHPEPYVYVSAWGEIDRGNPYWNDRAFNGSSFDYDRLMDEDDPVTAALTFMLDGHRILHQA